jgi:hypothetical protein
MVQLGERARSDRPPGLFDAEHGNNADTSNGSSNSSDYDNDSTDLVDVERCAKPERMCIPRMAPRWAASTAALTAITAVGLVFGVWFGVSLGAKYALVGRVQRQTCTVIGHTVLASRWGYANSLFQVPGINVRLASGLETVARLRLLWDQSWMEAPTIAPYLSLYPIGISIDCFVDPKAPGAVSVYDGINGLDGELAGCIIVALSVGVAVLWAVYKLVGPRRAWS